MVCHFYWKCICRRFWVNKIHTIWVIESIHFPFAFQSTTIFNNAIHLTLQLAFVNCSKLPPTHWKSVFETKKKSIKLALFVAQLFLYFYEYDTTKMKWQPRQAYRRKKKIWFVCLQRNGHIDTTKDLRTYSAQSIRDVSPSLISSIFFSCTVCNSV